MRVQCTATGPRHLTRVRLRRDGFGAPHPSRYSDVVIPELEIFDTFDANDSLRGVLSEVIRVVYEVLFDTVAMHVNYKT